MLRKLSHLVLVGLLALAFFGTAHAGLRAKAKVPHRYSPGALDQSPALATDPLSGATWSAWAYRTGGEYAIALSISDADGFWSEPTFIGLDDRLDQMDAALLADASGNLYLAYAVRETGTVHMSAFHAGSDDWFEPQQVTQVGERASSPTLSVIGDRLVLAYLSGRNQVRVLDWALLPPLKFDPNGVQEGPDGFPLPTKHYESPGDDEADLPAEEEPSPGGFGKKGPSTGQGGG